MQKLVQMKDCCIRTCIIGNADFACFVSILFVQLMFDRDQESGWCFIFIFIFTMVLFLWCALCVRKSFCFLWIEIDRMWVLIFSIGILKLNVHLELPFSYLIFSYRGIKSDWEIWADGSSNWWGWAQHGNALTIPCQSLWGVLPLRPIKLLLSILASFC